MGFAGKRKKGLHLSRTKKSYYSKTMICFRSPGKPPSYLSPGRSPFRKKLKIASQLHLQTPVRQEIMFKSSTPIRSCKKQLPFQIPNDETWDLSPAVDDMCENLSLLDISKNDEDTIKGESDESKDDSLSIATILPDVLCKLENEGKKEIIQKFFRLIKEGRFPLQNIAFLLSCDVEWYDKSDSRLMRYSPETLRFFWVGQKLFGGRFIHYMSGMKNETEQLKGNMFLDPQESRINFACPSSSVLSSINPFEDEMPVNYKPGFLEPMIQYKAKKADELQSFVLMFDGKKIKRGTDVYLLGYEKNTTLQDRIDLRNHRLELLQEAIEYISKIQVETKFVQETPEDRKPEVMRHLVTLIMLYSETLRELREILVKKALLLNKLKEKSGPHDWRTSKFAFSIDSCRTFLWKLDNATEKVLNVQRPICEAGAHLNGAGHLFTKSDTVNLNCQENLRFLKAPEKLPPETDMTNTRLIKQRTDIWCERRKQVRVTGSTIFQAIGCDGLKRQREHFDKVIRGIEPSKPSVEQQKAMKHGTKSEIHQIATMCGIVMPLLYPDLTFYKEGYCIIDKVLVSPDGSLRSSDGSTVFAFEGKAPVDKVYTTTVHYKVPGRYVTQVLFEQRATAATKGTLYMSWTPKSCTVFKSIPNPVICDSILNEIEKVYYSETAKRPTRLSFTSKQLKREITEAAENFTFIGEFPSVRGLYNEADNRSDASSPYIQPLSSDQPDP